MPPIKLLRTADWHIGQPFHDYDRSYEHQLFLDWLVDTIMAEQIDVLLVSGDIFDVSNPWAASIRLCCTFLKHAVLANPQKITTQRAVLKHLNATRSSNIYTI